MEGVRKISVVYLMWLPYGIKYFESFIISYLKYAAGYDHQLVVCYNGVNNKKELIEYSEMVKFYNLNVLSFTLKEGQDIEAYKYISRNVISDYHIYFNTFSEIRSEQWLKYYVENFNSSIGLISATGSLQSYYSSVFQKHSFKWEVKKGFEYNFKKYKLFVKAFFYWRFLFKPFPNPHARTNAFMVDRAEFLEMHSAPVNSKFQAYIFENGRKSLTNYYLQKGKKVLVVGKNGKCYEPADWADSFTFWRGEQQNLLVSDNQTTIYDVAGADEKIQMIKLAWGIYE